MKLRRSYHNSVSFLDLLFNGWLIYVFLFIVSFLLIVPERNKAEINTKAEFVIILTWDDTSVDDIDLWIEDPNKRVVYYKRKENGLVHLDRDDMGIHNDKVVLNTGESIVVEKNQEIATIRGFIPGEWVINIHVYRKTDLSKTNAMVRILKLNPAAKCIVEKGYILEKHWQEITVARIMMTSSGKILSISDLPKKLIMTRESSGIRMGN